MSLFRLRLRRASVHSAGKYVAGAYIVFVAILLFMWGSWPRGCRGPSASWTELRRDVEAQRGARDSDREREPVA